MRACDLLQGVLHRFVEVSLTATRTETSGAEFGGLYGPVLRMIFNIWLDIVSTGYAIIKFGQHKLKGDTQSLKRDGRYTSPAMRGFSLIRDIQELP